MKSGHPLYLKRSDMMLLVFLVFLVSAMTFTMGVLVGYGLNPSETIVAHMDTAAAGERGPASVGAETQETPKEPGEGLRKAFRESKQETLNQMERFDHTRTPKSVRDAQAHHTQHQDWDRSPAAALAKAEEKKQLAKRQAQAQAQLQQGPSPKVKGLFERSPSSLEQFEPRPGSFTVQVASYPTRDEAQMQVRRLRENHMNDAYMSEYKMSTGETWYRVGVGSFADADRARAFGRKAVREQVVQDFVVRRVQ